MTKRMTIYLEEDLHRALRIMASETGASISALVNEAVRRSLAEDAEDISAFAERLAEPSVALEGAVRALRRNGSI